MNKKMNKIIKIIFSFILLLIVLLNTTVYGVTIVIDPGHGGTDSGAVKNDVTEKVVNLKIATYLKEYLSQYNAKVILTRTDDTYLTLEQRAQIARDNKADLFLSIHNNSSISTSTNGAEAYITYRTDLPKYNANMSVLANKMLDNISALGILKRKLDTKIAGNQDEDPAYKYYDGQNADFYGVIRLAMKGQSKDLGPDFRDGSGISTVLLEHVYLSNPNDATFIKQEANIKKLAEADGKAIVEYFKIPLYHEKYSNTPFEDVYTGDWFTAAVEYVYTNGIIKGYNETTFAPNDKLTRGMLVTILYRMEGEQDIEGTPIFPDVQDNNQYYYKAVKWATDNNIVSGYDTGLFGPNDNITREQLAVILNKYAKYKEKDVSAYDNLEAFSDRFSISDYAVEQVKWAVGAGVITGNADGTINPKGDATRAEVAAMLEKYCKKVGR